MAQGVPGGVQSGSGSVSGVAGDVQGSLQGTQSGLETSKPKEDRVHRSRKIKPLLPPAVLQPQTSVSQPQSSGPQSQTVVPPNGGSHGKNKVILPPVVTSPTLPAEDLAKDALKTTEHILSELTPKKEDDRLDAITAESFFAPPPEEDSIPVETPVDTPVLNTPESLASIPEQPVPVTSQQSVPLTPQQPVPIASQQPTPLTPQQPTPLPFSPPSEQSPFSPPQQLIPPTQLTTPVTPMTPQRPINETPLTPFIPKGSSPLLSHKVSFACGPHHITTQLPHDNYSLLSFSSLDGPLTHGKKREKVLQWLKTQEEASRREVMS